MSVVYCCEQCDGSACFRRFSRLFQSVVFCAYCCCQCSVLVFLWKEKGEKHTDTKTNTSPTHFVCYPLLVVHTRGCPTPQSMSSMQQNPPRNSSNSLSSQASMTLQAATTTFTSQQQLQPGAGKGKSRKRKDHSPPSPSLLPDGNSVVQQQQPCSLAIPITSSFSKPANKQGFRFSLRRMLYNSPLVSQRRSRSLSGGNNIGNPAPSSSSTGGLRKRQSPSTCESSLVVFWLLSHLKRLICFTFFPQPDMSLKALQIPPALPSQSCEFPTDLSGAPYLRTGNVPCAWPNAPANFSPNFCAARTVRA